LGRQSARVGSLGWRGERRQLRRGLEGSGYVTRNPDPANRRATLVKLTPQGRHELDSVWSLHVRAVQRWFARHVDAHQAKVLVEVFSAVANNLQPSRK
jgi:DNA-binding MarR family transcriptional regulator